MWTPTSNRPSPSGTACSTSSMSIAPGGSTLQSVRSRRSSRRATSSSGMAQPSGGRHCSAACEYSSHTTSCSYSNAARSAVISPGMPSTRLTAAVGNLWVSSHRSTARTTSLPRRPFVAHPSSAASPSLAASLSTEAALVASPAPAVRPVPSAPPDGTPPVLSAPPAAPPAAPPSATSTGADASTRQRGSRASRGTARQRGTRASRGTAVIIVLSGRAEPPPPPLPDGGR
mmetsp:Transcript_3087/g.9272  ORF Transcript_3087/g.9272 Transcript_3087/m.9272 type:complete len:230 (+) Transcript_3087:1787-2476(+)